MMHRNRAIAVGLGLLALVLAALALLQHGPDGWVPGCAFRKMTGLSCPGCGMTRAGTAVLRGRFVEALGYNPVGVVLLPLALAGIGIELAGWMRGRPLAFRMRLGARSAWFLAGTVILYWILRNLPWWPFSLLAPPG